MACPTGHPVLILEEQHLEDSVPCHLLAPLCCKDSRLPHPSWQLLTYRDLSCPLLLLWHSIPQSMATQSPHGARYTLTGSMLDELWMTSRSTPSLPSALRTHPGPLNVPWLNVAVL